MGVLEGFIHRELAMKRQAMGAFLGQMITPSLYLALFVTALSGNIPYMAYGGREVPYVLYVLPGIVAIQMLYTFPYVASVVFNDRRFGLIRSFFIARGKPHMYLLGKLLAEGFVLLLTLLLLIGMCALITGYLPSAYSALLLIAVGLPTFVFWLSLGTMLGLVLRRETTRAAVFTLLNLPLIFTAPVFYDVGTTWLRYVSSINPLTYQVMALREAFLTGSVDGGLLAGTAAMGALMLCISYVVLERVSPR
jgi:ABC-2 type transport system permease protein